MTSIDDFTHFLFHQLKLSLRKKKILRFILNLIFVHMKFTIHSKINSNWSTINHSKDTDPISRYHVHVAQSSGNCFFFFFSSLLLPLSIYIFVTIHSSTILILNKKLIKSQTRALETLNNSSNSHSCNNDEDLFFFLGNVNNKTDFFFFNLPFEKVSNDMGSHCSNGKHEDILNM